MLLHAEQVCLMHLPFMLVFAPGETKYHEGWLCGVHSGVDYRTLADTFIVARRAVRVDGERSCWFYVFRNSINSVFFIRDNDDLQTYT